MTDATATVTVTILNELGLHAKPAMAFGELASKYDSDIKVSRTDNAQSVDGKSMLSMLTLMLTAGTEIRIDATGGDAERAVNALVSLVRSRFCEE